MIHKSITDLTVKNSTLVELLRYRSTYQPDQIAYTFLVDGEMEEVYLTYRELDYKARMVATQLQNLGKPGQRALLLYLPGLEYISAFFGCLYAGIIAVPVYPPDITQLNRILPRFQNIIDDAKPSFALTITSSLGMFESLLTSYPYIQCLATDEIDKKHAESWQNAAIDSQSIAFLQYTSGSTGIPKGVILTHSNLLNNSALIYQTFRHSPNSLGVIWLPPYHDMGLIGGIIQPLYGGFPVVLMSPLSFLRKPSRWLKAISRYKGTTSGGPNFAYDLCVRKISTKELDDIDLSSWQVAFNGAEPIRADTLRRFYTLFTSYGFRPSAFYPCYGLAESTLIVSGAKSELSGVKILQKSALEQKQVIEVVAYDIQSNSLISSGQPMSDQKTIIVNPNTLRQCSPEQVGEIWLSGPSVAHGYWEKPDETAHVFHAYIVETNDGPFLRTGDLGFLKNNELFIIGRLKDLIIIRGRNHYPQDIELTVEQSHLSLRPGSGAAFSVDILGEEQLIIVQEIESKQQNLNMDEVVENIRRCVAEYHNLLVHAVVLIRSGTIPKTSSGKIMRYACREMFLANKLSVVSSSRLPTFDSEGSESMLTFKDILMANSEERRAQLDIHLQKLVAHVLKLTSAKINPQQPIVTLGIDSLLAVELQNRIESSLGIDVSTVDLLRGINILQLTDLILEQFSTTRIDPMEPSSTNLVLNDTYIPQMSSILRRMQLPLSFAQKRFWFLSQFAPNSPDYHIPVTVRLRGPLTVGLLEQSINEVIRRHEILRTTFIIEGNQLVQRVILELPFRLRRVNLYSPKLQEGSDLHQKILHEVCQPFDLVNGPLFRASLVQLHEEEYILLLVAHHIICDSHSIDILIREIATLYGDFSNNRPSSLPELPIQYADFAYWQYEQLKNENLEKMLAYWTEKLKESPPLLKMPTTHYLNSSPKGTKGARRQVILDSTFLTSLYAFCRQHGVTPFMLMLTVQKITFYRWTGQTDIVIGIVTSDRVKSLLKNLIGCFINFLPIRSTISEDATGLEFLERVKATILEAYLYQECPFDKIVEAINPARNFSSNPIYNVAFVMQTPPPINSIYLNSSLNASFEGLVYTNTSQLDLRFIVGEQCCANGMSLECEYNTELFDSDTIFYLVESYCEMLREFIQNPQMRLSQFKLCDNLTVPTTIETPEEDRVIAIAATFTAEPIEKVLNYWIKEHDFSYDVKLAPYNQVFQQLLEPNSLFSRNTNGINVILLRFQDWGVQSNKSVNPETMRSDTANQVEQNVRYFVGLIESVMQNVNTPYLICVCPATSDVLTDREFCALENLLISELTPIPNIYIVPSAELVARYPVSNYYDSYTDELGNVPYTPAFFIALGTMVTRKIYSFQKSQYKVIVLDCDQTLWRGICGEEGAFGVEIDVYHRALQQFMVTQHDMGMLLCLCSKNSEEDVVSVFEHRSKEMLLKKEHILCWRINWLPKSENIKSLAAELCLGVDTFIFVDDDPVECAEVRANCPEVLTLQLPREPSEIPKFLNHVWAFDHNKVNVEDTKRTALYKQNRARDQLQAHAITFADFLISLDLKIQIEPMSLAQIQRVSQLTKRVNQFNFTSIRRSESEILKLCRSGEFECLVVEVNDRFGDYGLVGAMIFSNTSSSIKLDTFILSCRALGRTVEYAMLAKLGEIAIARGLNYIEIFFSPTQKNLPAFDFLNQVGNAFRQSLNDGFLFELPAEYAIRLLK